MTNTKQIFLSSLFFLFIVGCKSNSPLEIDLDENVIEILTKFTKEDSFYFEEENKGKFRVFYLLKATNEDGVVRLQVYLMENKLHDFTSDYVAHTHFNNLDVVIYGELNPMFYKLNKDKKSNYVHVYGSSEGHHYDPPYWNLYFNKEGKLIETFPKEVYQNLNIAKA